MSEQQQQHDQEQPGPSRVLIWRTAKGEARWKITVRVGEEDEPLDRAVALALATDRRLQAELAAPAFEGSEPQA